MKRTEPNYIILLNWTWETLPMIKGFRSVHLSLFLAIVDSINKNRWNPTMVPFELLINKSGLSGKRAYLEARQWLIENGLISVTPGKNGYQMALFSLGPEVQYSTATDTATSTTNGTTTSQIPVRNSTANGTHYNKHKTNTDKHETLNSEFEKFWELYDYKKDRPGTLKEFIKLTEEERLKAFEYIPGYKTATPDKKYRKHPARFLKLKTFNDELLNTATNKGRINNVCQDFESAAI